LSDCAYPNPDPAARANEEVAECKLAPLQGSRFEGVGTLFGIWWLDPLVALGIAAVAVREGQKAWRGEACECATF
jgi:hypothetical protein